MAKSTKKFKKENLKERIEHNENSWAKLGEQLAGQTKTIYGQLGDIFNLVVRLQQRVELLEKEVAKLQKK